MTLRLRDLELLARHAAEDGLRMPAFTLTFSDSKADRRYVVLREADFLFLLEKAGMAG